jgi:hypothetical protein
VVEEQARESELAADDEDMDALLKARGKKRPTQKKKK